MLERPGIEMASHAEAQTPDAVSFESKRGEGMKENERKLKQIQ